MGGVRRQCRMMTLAAPTPRGRGIQASIVAANRCHPQTVSPPAHSRAMRFEPTPALSPPRHTPKDEVHARKVPHKVPATSGHSVDASAPILHKSHGWTALLVILALRIQKHGMSCLRHPSPEPDPQQPLWQRHQSASQLAFGDN